MVIRTAVIILSPKGASDVYLLILAGGWWMIHMSHVRLLVMQILFSVSAPQEDCLWRSSLKVPRATRPLSDCCSRIKDPLVSSEDRDNDTYTLNNTHPHSSSFILYTWQRLGDHHTHLDRKPFDFNNTPCLNVYIKRYFCQCGSSGDYDVLFSWYIYFVYAFPKLSCLEMVYTCSP